jgi:hypothetical protein
MKTNTAYLTPAKEKANEPLPRTPCSAVLRLKRVASQELIWMPTLITRPKKDTGWRSMGGSSGMRKEMGRKIWREIGIGWLGWRIVLEYGKHYLPNAKAQATTPAPENHENTN